jgi:hypothetical protein
MLVTDVAGGTFTVERGAEGTTPAGHTGGATVKAITSEGALVNFEREHWVHGSSSPKLAITDPVTELRATVSDFTWVNQSTSTAQDIGGKILMTAPVGAGADNAHSLVITAPTAPYAIIGAFTYHSERGGAGTASPPFPQAGLIARESSTGKFMTIRALPRAGTTSAQRWNAQIKRMTNPTTFSLSLFNNGWSFGGGPIWFKIEDDNTDLVFYTSPNGIDWIELYSEIRTSFMSGGPNQVGFGINVSEGAGSISYKSYMELLHFGVE